jgi:hypothetical protein
VPDKSRTGFHRLFETNRGHVATGRVPTYVYIYFTTSMRPLLSSSTRQQCAIIECRLHDRHCGQSD